MPEPTMDQLRGSLTHTSYCAVLQHGAFDRAEVCGCWCHERCATCGWTGYPTQFLGLERRRITHPSGPHAHDWLPQLLASHSTERESAPLPGSEQ